MSIIRRMLKQKAVYWAPAAAGPDEFGQPQFDAPVELRCRWENVGEEYIDPQGSRQLSQSKVYVESDVELSGFLLLGSLDDLDAGEIADPRSAGAMEIVMFSKVPNLKNTEYLRTAFMKIGRAG